MQKKETKPFVIKPFKHIVLVESPVKKRSIQWMLGDDYLVWATGGHFRSLYDGTPITEPPSDDIYKIKLGDKVYELDEAKKQQIKSFLATYPKRDGDNPLVPESNPGRYLALDMSQGYKPYYWITKPNLIANLTPLIKQMKPGSVIYLASDPDREGEGIAWHLIQTLANIVPNGVTFKRMRFYSIGKKEIVRAVDEAENSVHQGLVASYRVREILDRLVGYPTSRALWSTGKTYLSMGRVQIAALEILLEQEEKALQTLPTIFTSIKATNGAFEVSAHLDGTVDENKARKSIESQPATIKEFTSEKSELFPNAPYTLAAFQKDMNMFYKLSAAKSLAAAQYLYEKGACLPAGSLVYLSNGQVKPIEDLIVGEEVIGLNMNTYEHINAKITNKIALKSETVDIIAERNEKITCTPDHPLLKFNHAGPPTWVNAEDLTHGDYIAVPRNIQINRPTTPLDILDIITQPNVWITIESELANRLNKVAGEYSPPNSQTRGSIRWALKSRNEIRIPVIKYLIEKGHVTKDIFISSVRAIRYGKSAGRNAIIVPNGKLPPRFWYLVGMLAGDGCYSRRGVVSFPTTSSEKFTAEKINEIAKEMNWIFPVKDYGNQIVIRGSIADFLADALTLKSVGKKCFKITVPDMLQKSSYDDICAFIAGLWDTDGCITCEKRRTPKVNCIPVVLYTTSSFDMIKKLRLTFKTLGIVGSIHRDKRTLAWHFKISQYTINQFAKYITPWLIHRKSAWVAIKDAVIDPVIYLPSIIMSTLDTYRVKQGILKKDIGTVAWSNYTRKNKISDIPASFLQHACTIINTIPDWVQSITNNNSIEWLKINKIHQAKEVVDVYDITTTSSNFIADGILVHNCSYVRTSSNRFSYNGYLDIKELAQQAGVPVSEKPRYVTNNQAKQAKLEAHEAIRPKSGALADALFLHWKTNPTVPFGESKGAHKKGYVAEHLNAFELLMRRAIAAVMPNCEIMTNIVKLNHPTGIELSGKAIHILSNKSFLDIWCYWNPETKFRIDNLKKGQIVKLKVTEVTAGVQHEHRPYVQELVTILDERKIGRPSSTASMLETLQRKGYVNWGMSRVGAFITSMHQEALGDVLNSKTTAWMDSELDRLKELESEETKLAARSILDDIYGKLVIKLPKTRIFYKECGKVLETLPTYLYGTKSRLIGFDGIQPHPDEELLNSGKFNDWQQLGSMLYIVTRWNNNHSALTAVWKMNKSKYIVRTFLCYQTPDHQNRIGFISTVGTVDTINAHIAWHQTIRTTFKKYPVLDFTSAWKLFIASSATLEKAIPNAVVLDGLFATLNCFEGENTIQALSNS